jgi:uncharacterized membrane-anchored protein
VLEIILRMCVYVYGNSSNKFVLDTSLNFLHNVQHDFLSLVLSINLFFCNSSQALGLTVMSVLALCGGVIAVEIHSCFQKGKSSSRSSSSCNSSSECKCCSSSMCVNVLYFRRKSVRRYFGKFFSRNFHMLLSLS